MKTSFEKAIDNYIKENTMKKETSDALQVAYDICEEEDRSMEYTIQFMMDAVDVSHDCVMNWLYANRDKSNENSLCTICHKETVNTKDGFDTCRTCMEKM